MVKKKTIAIVLATALKLDRRSPENIVWWCDNRNTILKQSSDIKDDPAAAILSSTCLPKITWDKGHATNPHINNADKAATRARDNPDHKIDVDFCYTTFNVEAICSYRKAYIPQAESTLRYVRRVEQFVVDDVVKDNIAKQTPLVCTDKKKLLSLTKIPGACDIMQMLTRRAVLQLSTKRKCRVPGCGATATAQHVLTMNDAAHSANGDVTEVYEEQPLLDDILVDFAKGDKEVIRYVCKRLMYQEDEDYHLNEWCAWTLRYLNLK